jgi:hypothetical protein
MTNEKDTPEQRIAHLDLMIDDRTVLLRASQNSLSELEDAEDDPILVELLNERKRLLAEQEEAISRRSFSVPTPIPTCSWTVHNGSRRSYENATCGDASIRPALRADDLSPRRD